MNIMTNVGHGRLAEAKVVEYLISKGYRIIDMNWRTRWCEIDIVAVKQSVVHLVEVKYRRSSQYGDGLMYITSQKLRQMQLAARFWQASHVYCGAIQLSAAAVSGNDYQVTGWIEDITT